MTMQAGWGEVDYTPEPGLPLLGQMHERIATHARDPLFAVSLALRSDETTVVIVACDVCVLDNEFVAAVQERWNRQTGLPASHLLIHATHTHVAPVSSGSLISPGLAEFEAHLQAAVLQAAQEAVNNLEQVEVFASRGYLEHMGWNRRAMFENGTSKMYGNSEMPGFIGMEGPRDGDLPLLWTKNEQGQITGALTGFASHPNCLEGEYFYSADLPGASRKYLKQMLGNGARVLYLTGASGNTAPSILDPHDPTHPWRGEVGVERSGMYLAGEAAKVLSTPIQAMHEPKLQLEQTSLQIPLRPWPQPDEPTYPRWEGIEYYAREEKLWPKRMQEKNPFEVRVNVLRIGDAAICTNPAELFVEFGLQVKEASPARVTFVSELTDGYCGYVPTLKAFERGGYETWCAPSSQLDPQAGDQIVTATRGLFDKTFEIE